MNVWRGMQDGLWRGSRGTKGKTGLAEDPVRKRKVGQANMHQQQCEKRDSNRKTHSQEARHNKESEFASYLGEETNSHWTTVGEIWHRTKGRGGRGFSRHRSIHRSTHRTEMDIDRSFQELQWFHFFPLCQKWFNPFQFCRSSSTFLKVWKFRLKS